MPLKSAKPTSPGRRALISVVREGLHRGKPFKALTKGKPKTGGRNNRGRITTRHIGGGHKQSYRLIDFKRKKLDATGEVLRLEYDPNRSCFIALIKYEDGEHAYILAPQKLAAGDHVVSADQVDVKPGNAAPLFSLPVGTLIHNIELQEGRGGQMVRAAGGFAQIVGRDKGYAQVRLKSGEIRMVPGACKASVGTLSNPDNKNKKLGKAGRKRWLGVRPTVRGVAMNPIDHPHGGGEGKTAGGRHPVSPWGKPTKGKKTRKKSASNRLIVRARGKKR